MEEGMQGWCKAGFFLFTGVNVPSKAHGEFVKHTYKTPSMTPETVKTKMDRGEKMVMLDSRPANEYGKMHIPGAIDTPGAELVYRVHDLAASPETIVVVNRAGRTRSIIGAQSLINAGIPNPVFALENVTMGWVLTGYELEFGEGRFTPSPSSVGLIKARSYARHVAKRFGVKKVDYPTLMGWNKQLDGRTLYLFAPGPGSDQRKRL